MVLAVEEVFISMCRSLRVKIFIPIANLNDRCFCCVTAAMFVSIPPRGTNMVFSLQSSINLGDILLRIACELKTAKTWFFARLFILQSSILFQILEFIYWTVAMFSFDHVTDENGRLQNQDRIGLTKPGLDWTGLTKPGSDCVRLTKPGPDPKKIVSP